MIWYHNNYSHGSRSLLYVVSFLPSWPYTNCYNGYEPLLPYPSNGRYRLCYKSAKVIWYTMYCDCLSALHRFFTLYLVYLSYFLCLCAFSIYIHVMAGEPCPHWSYDIRAIHLSPVDSIHKGPVMSSLNTLLECVCNKMFKTQSSCFTSLYNKHQSPI